ncbi:MAG: outer membrane lipid asymmetry maintenance protein MlaD [Methylophagaceae bacterium]
MMQNKSTEITVGMFVAAGIAALFMLAMKVSNLAEFTDETGYQVIAEFENIGGLKVRSPVTMAGVRVGRVGDISLNPDSYNAQVTLNLYGKFDNIPTDTAASIYTAGLLGEQYIGLEAGAEEEFLQNGDVIDLTQPALVLEQVIGQFLFSKAEGGDE